MNIEEYALGIALRVRERMREQHEAATAEHHKALSDAVRNGATLPAGYWEKRYRAEERLRAIDRIVEALRDP